jgi:putative ABC transport system substrate-binding protein
MQLGQLERRAFMTLLGGAAAWPIAARAEQQPAMPVIGFLHSSSAEPYTHVVTAFRRDLKQSGYVEGHNVAIEYRWANNDLDRLPELAADLVRRQVAVIVSAGGASSALAAKAATSTIPIVLAFGSDPVRLGLVASMSRPGGNVSGATFRTTELMAKRLDLLRELVPQTKTVAFLAPDQRVVAAQEQVSDIRAGAAALGLKVAVAEARNENDFEPAFADLCNAGLVGSLLVRARFSTAVATNSWHWRRATSCPRSTKCANMLWTAA